MKGKKKYIVKLYLLDDNIYENINFVLYKYLRYEYAVVIYGYNKA